MSLARLIEASPLFSERCHRNISLFHQEIPLSCLHWVQAVPSPWRVVWAFATMCHLSVKSEEEETWKKFRLSALFFQPVLFQQLRMNDPWSLPSCAEGPGGKKLPYKPLQMQLHFSGDHLMLLFLQSRDREFYSGNKSAQSQQLRASESQSVWRGWKVQKRGSLMKSKADQTSQVTLTSRKSEAGQNFAWPSAWVAFLWTKGKNLAELSSSQVVWEPKWVKCLNSICDKEM